MIDLFARTVFAMLGNTFCVFAIIPVYFYTRLGGSQCTLLDDDQYRGINWKELNS